MSDENETNQEAQEQPNAEVQPEGQAPEGEAEAQESTESQPSPEEIQAHKEFKAQLAEANITGDPRELMADYTRKSQALKQQEQLLGQYQGAIQQLSGTVQQQRNPLLAAEAEYAEALQTFDPGQIQQAMQKVRAIEREQMRNEMNQIAANSMQAAQGFEKAKKFGVQDMSELSGIATNLSVEDLAVVKAYRDGNLPQVFEQEKVSREKNARDAERLQSIMDGTGGRMVPGADGGDEDAVIEVPASVYYAFPESVAKKNWPNAKVVSG